METDESVYAVTGFVGQVGGDVNTNGLTVPKYRESKYAGEKLVPQKVAPDKEVKLVETLP